MALVFNFFCFLCGNTVWKIFVTTGDNKFVMSRSPRVKLCTVVQPKQVDERDREVIRRHEGRQVKLEKGLIKTFQL